MGSAKAFKSWCLTDLLMGKFTGQRGTLLLAQKSARCVTTRMSKLFFSAMTAPGISIFTEAARKIHIGSTTVCPWWNKGTGSKQLGLRSTYHSLVKTNRLILVKRSRGWPSFLPLNCQSKKHMSHQKKIMKRWFISISFQHFSFQHVVESHHHSLDGRWTLEY